MATLEQAARPLDTPSPLPNPLSTASQPTPSNNSKTMDTSRAVKPAELYLVIDADGKPQALAQSPNGAKNNSTSTSSEPNAPQRFPAFELPPDLAVQLALASHNLPADQLVNQFNYMLRQVYIQTLLTMRRPIGPATQAVPHMTGLQPRSRPVVGPPQGVVLSPEAQHMMGVNLPAGTVMHHIPNFQMVPGQPPVQNNHGNLNGHAAQPIQPPVHQPHVQAQRIQQLHQHLHNQQHGPQHNQQLQQQLHQHQVQHQQAVMQQHMAQVQALHQMQQQAAAQGVVVQPFQPVQVQINAAQQPVGGQPRNPAARREEMRDILAPFVRVLWAILRILFVLYFFHDPSRSIWRVMALVGLGVAIYAVQTGMLIGILGDRLEWARRYLDEVLGGGVLGVPPQRGQQRQQRNQNQNRNRNGNEHQRQANGQLQQPGLRHGHAAGANAVMPDPRVVADRLVANRQAGNRNWLIERLHAAERVIVLFLASLWPGIGEQAVRVQNEREEAERRRRREEEERRLELERLEIEQREQQVQQEALENASTIANDGQVTNAGDNEVQDEWVDEVDAVNVGGVNVAKSSEATGHATGIDAAGRSGESSGTGLTRVNQRAVDGESSMQ